MAIRIGTNRNNLINGTRGNDIILGLGGDDTINSGAGNDWVFAGNGNDIIYGADGNDFLFGGAGNDVLDGGRGRDFVDGGSGSDTLIFTAADGGGFDTYNGGTGVDTIVLELTAAQWANSAIKSEILALVARINSGNVSEFTLRTLNLSVANIEIYQVKVDNVVINPLATGNTVPVATNDAFAISENGALGAGSTVIANDTTGTGFTVALVGGPALGVLAINGNGTFSYNPGTAYDFLAAGASANAAFTYTITNSAGVSNIATVNITITGTNDIPTVTGAFTGGVNEDGGLAATAGGRLIVSDADAAQSGVIAAVLEGTYGTLNLQADGNWTYQLDNSRAATQALNGGVTATESFGVKAIDGTDLDNIQITVTGTNDAATSVFVLDEGSAAQVIEDGASTITGKVNVSDVDAGEAGILFPGRYVGTYGALTIDTNGVSSYTLDQESAITQALNGGLVVTETFNLFSRDGTALPALVFEVNGENDTAEIFGNFGGFVDAFSTEETIGSSVSVQDIDTDESAVVSDTIVGEWGTFSIEGNGEWTYVRNGEPIEFIIDGEFIEGETFINDNETSTRLLETFTASTIDGTQFNVDIYTGEQFPTLS